MTINGALILLALIFLGLAAFNAPAPKYISWGWLGAFCWALASIVGRF